jgi:hypothetical protein
MRRVSQVIALAAIVLGAAVDPARAQFTRRNFIQPLVAEDAIPANQLDLTPWGIEKKRGNDFAMNFELDKKLSANSDLELSSPLNGFSPTRRKQITGFQDIEAIIKYAFYQSDEHESMYALAIDSIFPSGSALPDAVHNYRAGPLFLWDKGMGDLPNSGWAAYLRPFALQGDCGLLPTVGNPQSAAVLFNNAFSYSLDYFAHSSNTFALPEPLTALVPFTEFNYIQVPLGGLRERSRPDLRLTPGVAYLKGAYQLTVGTQAALNYTATRNGIAIVVVMMVVTLDQIFPQAAWTPF